VGEVRPVISQLDPSSRVLHRFILTPVDVDLSVREVWQAEAGIHEYRALIGVHK
jgi:hypothetical protein